MELGDCKKRLADLERERDEARALLKEAATALGIFHLEEDQIVAAQGSRLVVRIPLAAIQTAAALRDKIGKQTP